MDAFIGEVRPFAFDWIPDGWLACNGATYPLAQYQALYSVIGTVYGGTLGQNFKVPNLQGEAIIGAGQGPTTSAYTLAQTGGTEKAGLTVNQIPNHDHVFNGAIGATGFRTNTAGNTSYLTNFGYGGAGATTFTSASGYVPPGTPDTLLNPSSVTQTGGGGAHENRQPYLAVTYAICFNGYYPSRP
ncbi:Microcystin-dependent protein [Pedobacter sp. BAL39]|uniref:phage tail protein n=1 Tax=Pedobacter sp. BAL39 TaxID=391596 RepID=UPI00015599D1|nr:tail fiber protein [Pedobacter sp. BAL39]EDM37311.1 Microcystin-dependent protein [Pedobacter sp. BAL39]